MRTRYIRAAKKRALVETFTVFICKIEFNWIESLLEYSTNATALAKYNTAIRLRRRVNQIRQKCLSNLNEKFHISCWTEKEMNHSNIMMFTYFTTKRPLSHLNNENVRKISLFYIWFSWFLLRREETQIIFRVVHFGSSKWSSM